MKKLSILLTFIFGIALLFNACQNMEDIHSEYLKDGDIIYAPKPLIIQTFAGHNRIGLKYYLVNAVNVNKCIIEWNEGESSQTVDIAPNVPLDSIEIMVNNLEEKSYIFKVYTVDKHGNRSIKEQKPGSSYADRYQSGLTNRSLVGIEGGGTIDSLVLTWGTAITGNTGVELMYNNGAGEAVTKLVLPEDEFTIIKDWESEGEISYKSSYIPEENAIDTFMAEASTTMLPVFIKFEGEKIDNTNWTIVDFSTEEPGEGAPNGLASAAIDGDLGTFWHTQWDGGSPEYPHFFTVDLKDIIKINQIEVFRRSGDGRGQTRFEIHTSLDGVNYTSQGSFDYDPNSASQSYQLGSLPMARYIKYTATAGSNFFAFLAELDVYGQVASQVDRTNWEVIDFSSEEPAEANWGPPIQGLVAAAIDGELGTFWHSAWDQTQPDYPHYFVIDMQKTVRMLAVDCARRQGNGGGHTKFKIYSSNDGVNFEDQGTFDFNSQINDVQMFPLPFLPEARYFKFEAIEGPNNFTFLSEINVYGTVLD
ncbi:MAG: discoidin domain-containing protein [Bacteroidetes bacterium]|nr:discoidin domain-containing protein [Bacteroidota bacterium]